ncbi:hypothetical protein F383_06138 [Gossypium arboreum]|uniref:Uncharacterized protein n=1 Tax=Gossypium arboreum TaxID=29729 RepID=A0A0B0NGD3_GOSAR|nr:hypothetical protein F383_06138 [Gossypium arboreum]
MAFSELDLTWARQEHARVRLLQAMFEPVRMARACPVPV